eukprot:15380144-Alexandrium_andersonii.AAC.1
MGEARSRQGPSPETTNRSIAEVAVRARRVAPTSRGRTPQCCKGGRTRVAASTSCWSRGEDRW